MYIKRISHLQRRNSKVGSSTLYVYIYRFIDIVYIYIHIYIWNVITHSSSNFNGGLIKLPGVGVRAWTGDCIPYAIMDILHIHALMSGNIWFVKGTHPLVFNMQESRCYHRHCFRLATLANTEGREILNGGPWFPKHVNENKAYLKFLSIISLVVAIAISYENLVTFPMVNSCKIFSHCWFLKICKTKWKYFHSDCFHKAPCRAGIILPQPFIQHNHWLSSHTCIRPVLHGNNYGYSEYSAGIILWICVSLFCS